MSMCERGSILHGNKEIKVAQLHLAHVSCRMFPVCHSVTLSMLHHLEKSCDRTVATFSLG